MNRVYQKPESISSQKDNDNEFRYIVSHKKLSMLATDICNKLEHPLTIIDFGESDRVESTNIFAAIRTSCEAIRISVFPTLCEKCDSHHASIFKNISPMHNIGDALEQRIIDLCPLDFFSKKYLRPCLKKYIFNGSERYYVEYFCPILGYKELIFPLIIDGDIMGALFIGQFEIKDEDMHFKIREDFLHNNYMKELISCGYFDRVKHTTFSDLLRVINAQPSLDSLIENPFNVAFDLQKKPPKFILSLDELKDLIANSCQEIDALEKHLFNELQSKRDQYVRKFLQDIELDFYKEFTAFSGISYKQRDEMKKLFAQSLYKIIKEFDFSYVSIYSDATPSGMKVEGLVKYFDIYNTDHFTDAYKPKDTAEVSFSFTRISPQVLKPFVPECSFTNKSLFLGFMDVIPEDGNVVLVYASWAAMFHFEYVGNSYITNQMRSIFTIITSSMTNFLSAMSALNTSYIQNKFELTLHMYKHECTHIAQDLGTKNNDIFEYYRNSPPSKIADLCGDIRSSVLLINNIALIVGAVIGTLNPLDYDTSNDEISVFKDLLQKWARSYELDIREKNVSIKIPAVTKKDENRPYVIYSNKQLLEIIIYNLVDNAIKYCHWGSNIELDYRRYFPTSSVCIISVTSYGPYIEENRNPYKPYYRGSVAKNPIRGDGLGLYMVEQVAKLLGMEVYHKCNFISDYNIPLIDEYLNHKFEIYSKDNDLIPYLVKEKEKLSYRFFQIVNQHKTKPISDDSIAEESIIRNISDKTYKTTFYVEMKI